MLFPYEWISRLMKIYKSLFRNYSSPGNNKIFFRNISILLLKRTIPIHPRRYNIPRNSCTASCHLEFQNRKKFPRRRENKGKVWRTLNWLQPRKSTMNRPTSEKWAPIRSITFWVLNQGMLINGFIKTWQCGGRISSRNYKGTVIRPDGFHLSSS